MSSKEKWRKHNAFFQIDIKVGNAWVQQGRRDVEEDAIAEAKRILNDPSVSEVKVEEHILTHVCFDTFSLKDDPVLRVPPKMGDTGRKQSCPKCYNVAPVYEDGTTEWVFCADCDSSFPV